MKKLIILTSAIFLLNACSKNEPNIPENYDPNAMPGMPCHQMGGMYMGDCKFDENGNLIENDMSHGTHSTNNGETFSNETEGLPEAKPSEIVELKNGDTYQMTASIVKQEVGNQIIRRLAYNGQIPGPLLKVEKNAEVTIQFKNELDIETTVHSHGVRLENKFDGTPGLTQEPIKPGEMFTYKIKFPDEGIYWYHPHIREDYTQEMGLYGNFLVNPDEKNYWNEVNREEILILDDFFTNEENPDFFKDKSDHVLMGRFGNIMLINNEENFEMTAKKGEVIRFYLTNVANTRVFNLKIPGAKLKIVGGDIGRVEKEAMADSILLAPAERYIVEAYFPEEGTFEIEHQTLEKTYKLGKIFVKGEEENNLKTSFENLRSNSQDYQPFRSDIQTWIKKSPDKNLRISIEMEGMKMNEDMMNHGETETIEWEDNMAQMNAESSSENTLWKLIDEKTVKENMDINWQFKKGDLVKISIYNDPNSMHPMQHPIHFHGQRFLVLSRDGKVNENFQWKDTTLVKTGEKIEILVEMSNPGKWMAHCHIAEHLHSGMMMGFEVME